MARAARDPALAPFLGSARLATAFVLVPKGAAPRLAFLNPMEREEAGLGGLPLITPGDLDVVRWARDGATAAELLAHSVSRALQLCEVAPGPVALAGSWPAGQLLAAAELLAAEGWSFVDGEPVASLLRKRKSDAQVAAVARAAAGAVDAIGRVARRLATAEVIDGVLVDPHGGAGTPLRVGALRGLIGQALAEHGLEQPEGNLVAPGEEGAAPHTTGDDERVVRAGESLVVDVFPRGELFADCTRTFCVGPPSASLAAAHATVVEALTLARRLARPGTRAYELQEAVCDHFTGAGYETPLSHPGTDRGYVHGLGHGVGWELHEAPSFREHAHAGEEILEVGDVFTLEPGLYDPEEGWAVRLEDTFVLHGDGAVESLTPLPSKLDPRQWPVGGAGPGQS